MACDAYNCRARGTGSSDWKSPTKRRTSPITFPPSACQGLDGSAETFLAYPCPRLRRTPVSSA